MIRANYIEILLSYQPSISEIAQAADILESAADKREAMLDTCYPSFRYGFEIIIRDLRETAATLREMVYEAADFIAVPEWAYAAELEVQRG